MTQPADSLPPEVVDAWRAGNKIEAIKRLREATGIGLAEAKSMIDQLDGATLAPPPARMAARIPGLAPGEVPRRSGGWGIALLVAAVAAVAWAIGKYT